jgi:hypothetical protein
MLTLLTAALAADCPTPLTEEGLRTIVDDAKAAIATGDQQAHEDASKELERRIPCLAEQLSSRPWADYLVTYALVKHVAKDDDWNEPLSVALALVPDHPDVPAFVARDYLPPAEPTGTSRAIPEGVVVFLDGKVVLDDVPPLSGVHVLQAVVDGRWTSRLLIDEPVPDDFFPRRPPPDDPPPPPPRDPSDFSWGTLGLAGGLGGWRQVSFDERVADRDERGAAFTVASHGQVGFGSVHAGLFWNADFALQTSSRADGTGALAPFGSGFVGAGVLAPVTLLAGVGLTSVRVEEEKADGPSERPLLVPHYVVGLSARTAGDLPLDATVAGGFGPATSSRGDGAPRSGWGSHVLAQAGISPVDLGSVRLRFGLSARWGLATLGDQRQSLSDRPPLATARAWRAGVTVGLRWGS